MKTQLPPLWVANPNSKNHESDQYRLAWLERKFDTETLYVPAHAIREIIAKSRSVGVGLLAWATALAEIENYLNEAEG